MPRLNEARCGCQARCRQLASISCEISWGNKRLAFNCLGRREALRVYVRTAGRAGRISTALVSLMAATHRSDER
ncbi:hypothetical protein EYF80_057705 [Liparis tanakae]|uniref:Uncharacterized protein n=1 Tax=Liparis tanakae TaxID=230148 RepID=A0A4Z2ETA3_9TELE|nr:hypothetical protein EYF80_057705 [Liparis tanakae]